MSDQPTAPSAAGAPAATAPDATPTTPAVDYAARAAQLERELADFKVREGRYRNEKGVREARIRELEQLALNSSGQPDQYSQSDQSQQQWQPSQYSTQSPGYMPAADVVTRDEFDLYRFQRDNPDKFEAVKSVALDGNRVGNFIRYRVDAWGRPVVGPDGRAVGDIYATYSAIRTHLENEELRAKVSQASPNRNPAHATISGSGGSAPLQESDEAFLNDPNTTPEMIRERFPEQFAQDPGGGKSWLRG